MNNGLFQMVMGAGPMVKFVMLVLLFFSVFSWAIMIYKLALLRKVEKESDAFYDLFWQKRQFSTILASVKNYKNTPLARLFLAAHDELSHIRKADEAQKETPAVRKDDIDRIDRVLRNACLMEASRLEHLVPFLATTGNTAPFIGLFGTVWGIMTSFNDIGARGGASLAVVAPGISEALVATAFGLLAAIPAAVGYNHLVTRINKVNSRMEAFASDIVIIVDKQAIRPPKQE